MIHLYTIANKRPDLIGPQLRSMSRHLLEPFEFVVLNNAGRNGELSEAIKRECNLLNIRMVTVPADRSFRSLRQRNDPSRAACRALVYLKSQVLTKESEGEIVGVIDSDMFFIHDVKLSSLMASFDVAYIPQYREGGVKYMWSGFFLIDRSSVDISTLDFSLGQINGQRVDVGGFSHYWLQSQPDLRTLFLEFWNISDIQEGTEYSHYSTTLNGNVVIDFCLDKNGEVLSFTENGVEGAEHNYLAYEIPTADYSDYYVKNILGAVALFGEVTYHPIHVDFIRAHSQPMSESFIFHYKGGSNYSDFSTATYNEIKTRKLSMILNEEFRNL